MNAGTNEARPNEGGARVSAVVDSHQHFWTLASPWFDWPTPDLEAIHRDFGPADLSPLLAAGGVSNTVIVQAAPHRDETRDLLRMAERAPFVAGVVGWIDLERASHRSDLEQFAGHPKFRGIRPMIQSIPDPAWMLRPGLAQSLAAVERLGLTFDALVKPPHLDALTAFVDRYPNLPVVVDHGAKPEIAKGRDGFEAWAPKMAALAERPQVFCKLSGLLTEAGSRTGWDDLRPFVDHLLAAFGPQRLMWGSDWPVVELAAPYGTWLAYVRRYVARLSPDEQDAILGAVACRFYRLEPTGRSA
jgi:L-fuconolactonase